MSIRSVGPLPNSALARKYLRELPTPFCAGCGAGIVLNAFVRAVDELAIPQDRILVVSGIGCSSWIPSPFFKADTLHTTHGRPIAFATGAKLAKPKLDVVIFTGDGDCAAIGGNHLIHAARRDIDLTVLCINNYIFGMTGGQVAPTTPLLSFTTTTPNKNTERPFDLCRLVECAGASYVARWTTYHARRLMRSIESGIKNKGFSFIEVISQCPTHYGRKNAFEDAIAMMEWFEQSFGYDKSGRFKIGEFVMP